MLRTITRGRGGDVKARTKSDHFDLVFVDAFRYHLAFMLCHVLFCIFCSHFLLGWYIVFLLSFLGLVHGSEIKVDVHLIINSCCKSVF